MDGRALLLGVEAAGEQRVGLELGRAAVELPRVAQDHSGAAVHWLDDSTNLDVCVTVFPEFADVFAVFRETYDCEAALVVWRLRRADIKEARSVRKLHYIVY